MPTGGGGLIPGPAPRRENCGMDEQTKRKRRTVLTAVGIVILVAMVGYMLYCGLVIKKLSVTYQIVMAVGIFLFWLIESVISPIATDEFEGKTRKQTDAYKKAAALSLIGYMGLIYFMIAVNSRTGFYGAMVYVVTIMFKRRFMETYRGEGDSEEEEEETAEEETSVEEADSGTEESEKISDPLSQDASTRMQRLNRRISELSSMEAEEIENTDAIDVSETWDEEEAADKEPADKEPADKEPTDKEPDPPAV